VKGQLAVDVRKKNDFLPKGWNIYFIRGRFSPSGKVRCDVRKGLRSKQGDLLDFEKCRDFHSLLNSLPSEFYDALSVFKPDAYSYHFMIYPSWMRVAILSTKKGFEIENTERSLKLIETLL